MILCMIALVFAVLRIIGFKSMIFQALAHVYVGGLGGAWLVNRKPLYAILFVILCVVETLCFFLLPR